MLALRIVAIGHEQGVILPAEWLARLHVQPDGTVLAKEAPDGVTLLSADVIYEEQMRVARRLMRRREGVLRALARG